MTDVRLVRFRFKPDAKQIWLDWSEELKRRKDEVIATLKNEGVVSESCFISNDGTEAFYFMEAEDFKKVMEAAHASPHPIDAEHRRARESSLELAERMDCLFHFENRD